MNREPSHRSPGYWLATGAVLGGCSWVRDGAQKWVLGVGFSGYDHSHSHLVTDRAEGWFPSFRLGSLEEGNGVGHIDKKIVFDKKGILYISYVVDLVCKFSF